MPHGAIPFPFGDCRICNDKATGFHYGVATCEGCKGFFKRSIPKGDKYTCFFGGQCNITPFNRNRCKACRFKRCLDNGMAIDAVKMGRIPKVEKERALIEARGGSTGQPQMSLETELDDPLSLSNVDLDAGTWPDTTTAAMTQTSQAGHGQLTGQNLPTPFLSSAGVSQDESRRPQHVPQNVPQNVPQIVPPMTQPQMSFQESRWASGEDKASMQRRFSLQCGFESFGSGNIDHNSLRKQHEDVWGSGSSMMDTSDTPSRKQAMSMGEEINTFSSLALSNSSPKTFNDPFDGQKQAGECSLSSFDTKCQAMAMSATGAHNSMLYNSQSSGTPAAPLGIKLEPGVASSFSACQKETVYCDNPFAQPSQTTCQGPGNFTCSASLSPMTSTADGNSRLNDIPLQVREGRKYSTESSDSDVFMGNSNNSHNSQKENSGQVWRFSKCVQGGRDLEKGSKDNKGQGHQSRKKIYKRSSYSPDVIKVLLDQVGGDRIKGMKHQIMYTIAKTFGPEEYKATHDLLSTLTSATEQQNSPQRECQQAKQLDNPENISSFSEVFFDNNVPQHQSRPRMQSLPNVCVPSTGVTQYFKDSVQTPATMSHVTQAPQSRDTSVMDLPSPPSKDMSHTLCDLSPSESGHHDNHWLQQSKSLDLQDMSSKSNDSSREFGPLENDSFGLYGSNIVDSSEYSPSTGICPNAGLCSSAASNDHFFNRSYDASILDFRASDKASVSPNSQNSGSEKDTDSPDSSNVEELTMSETALTLGTAYEKHFVGRSKMYKRMQEFLQNKREVPIHPLTAEGKAQVYNNLITSIPQVNQTIIGYCQDVPGFSALHKKDKEILLKHGYYDIWMLSNSRLFHGDECYLQFDDGTFYSRAWMETILNPSMVHKFITFAKKFNSLGLANTEIAILCAIQLTAAGHEALDLQQREKVQQMNSHFVDLLVHEVSKQHPSNCSRILVDIFRLMPELAEINMLQQEIIANFSLDEAPDKVEYTPKPVPMADIPEAHLAVFDD